MLLLLIGLSILFFVFSIYHRQFFGSCYKSKNSDKTHVQKDNFNYQNDEP